MADPDKPAPKAPPAPQSSAPPAAGNPAAAPAAGKSAAPNGAAPAAKTAAPAAKSAPPASTVALDENQTAQWAAMVESDKQFDGEIKGGADRLLNQEEIDSLLGFSEANIGRSDNAGVRSIIDSAMVTYERLPMLEIVFDRLVRLMTTTLRTFTSDNVEVSLDSISSVRFGDYVNSIPLPSMLAVFKAEEWDNYGLITIDSNLIYAIIEVLLGGRRGEAIHVEGRPYTTIEINIIKRMIDLVLTDAEAAFKPLSPVSFSVDRLETNPRFAAITRPANAAIRVRLRIDMEDRGGVIEMLMPYATIEPIRGLLLQMFMGEKFGRDPTWEGHLATEIGHAQISVDAVLYEAKLPLKQLLKLEVGDTLALGIKPDALVTVRCGDVTLTEGYIGRVGDKVAVRVARNLRKPKTTFAMFENAAEPSNRMEAT